MTSNPETYAIGELYLIDIDIEVGHLRAMRTTDTALPWVAEDGALYADEAVNVIRRLIITDPGQKLTAGPGIDLTNVEGGYIEIDGKGWVPSSDYEQLAATNNEALHRLEALRMAAEFIPAPVAGLNIGGTVEQKFAHRVLAAARWVLTGNTKEAAKS